MDIFFALLAISWGLVKWAYDKIAEHWIGLCFILAYMEIQSLKSKNDALERRVLRSESTIDNLTNIIQNHDIALNEYER